jgi:hypothetical protein
MAELPGLSLVWPTVIAAVSSTKEAMTMRAFFILGSPWPERLCLNLALLMHRFAAGLRNHVFGNRELYQIEINEPFQFGTLVPTKKASHVRLTDD